MGARALEERAVKGKLEACEPIGVCEGQGSLSLDLETIRIKYTITYMHIVDYITLMPIANRNKLEVRAT